MFPDFLSILKFFDAKLVRASDHGDTEMGLLVSYIRPLSLNDAHFFCLAHGMPDSPKIVLRYVLFISDK